MAAILRVDQHIQAVDGIAIGLVRNNFGGTDQILIAVGVGKHVVVDHHTQRHTDQLVGIHQRQLPIGKVADQTGNGFLRPCPTYIVIDLVHEHLELRIIARLQGAQCQMQVFQIHSAFLVKQC